MSSLAPTAPADACDAVVSFLLDIVESQGAGLNAPSQPVQEQLRAMIAAWRPAQQAPHDLVGRPCPLPPPQWHLQKLIELVGRGGSQDDATRARRLYHARWLGHLLMPERGQFRPLVTIVIPVYNRAAMAAEAVESCLAQSWRPLEILVIDDGSTDNLEQALAPHRDAVRLQRQANRGVSSARNAGIRAAKGEFVHFLDSDDLLYPAAVARKIEAFARIADAELCYSLADLSGARAAGLPHIRVPDGSANCPTSGLLECGIRHPFYMPCVMMPRFTLLETGGFEEDLRRGEDSRFWVKIALRGVKVIGLAARLTERRLSGHTLSAEPIDRSLHLTIGARTIADFLGNRRGWWHAARSFADLLSIVLRNPPGQSLDAAKPDVARLLASIAALGSPDNGRSALPLLAHLRHLTRGAIQSHPGVSAESAALLVAFHAATDAAARRAAPLAIQDVRFWADAAASKGRRNRLASIMDVAARLLDQDPTSLAAIDELLRSAPVIPRKRALRRYVGLRANKLPRVIALPIALRGAK